MEALIILLPIAFLVVLIFVALKFKTIAEMKGHDGQEYFWWTLLVAPFGMLMVIALPDWSDRSSGKGNAIQEDELPDL